MRRVNLIGVVLLASLLALVIAFLFSLGAARRHFDRAMVAQSQLAAVSRIEALVVEGAPRALLADQLMAYRASIDREANLIGNDPTDIAQQTRERAEADRLATLALTVPSPSTLSDRVSQISAREATEAREAAAAMTRMRGRTTVLALLLASSAALAAVAGGFALIRSTRRLEREVEARTAELRAVDKSRRLFFAKASHELRTPVAVMRGEAEVSLADPSASPAELREALDHIVANAIFLGNRIDELLGLASAEDGRLHLDHMPLDLTTVAEAAEHAAAPYARSAEVAVIVDRPDKPLPIRGDARWLGQALLAILDNGVKFSPIGGTLRLRLARSGEDAAIEIIDQGHGLIDSDLPRIFDAYYQTEQGRSRGGTGLGLALARWVIEQHGGAIRAANDPAGGCRIAIRLPLEAAA